MYRKVRKNINGRDLTMMLTDDPKAPLLFTVSGHEDIEKFAEDLDSVEINIISAENVNWEDELTPWPAKGVMKKAPDFTGHADVFLREVTDVIIRKVEADEALEPDELWIGGYSLMGLFSIYAVLETDCFDRMFSASGSTWYDGFVDFLRNKKISEKLKQAYFSLGSRESSTKNQRMATVDDCTKAVVDEFRKSVDKVFFEYNKGGHFTDPEGRQAKAAEKLYEGYEKDKSIIER